MKVNERDIGIYRRSRITRDVYFVSTKDINDMFDSKSTEESSRISYVLQVLTFNWCNPSDVHKGTYGDFWYGVLEAIDNGQDITNTEILRNWTMHRAALGSYLQDFHDCYSDKHGIPHGKVEICKT